MSGAFSYQVEGTIWASMWVRRSGTRSFGIPPAKRILGSPAASEQSLSK